jgi:hypothetical protein
MTEKPNYQKELLELCRDWWAKYEQATTGEKLVKFDWPQVLHDFVKQVALDSFKNGIDAEKRRAGGHAPHAHGPRQRPAYTKGSAVANGRLKPVEAAPAAES